MCNFISTGPNTQCDYVRRISHLFSAPEEKNCLCHKFKDDSKLEKVVIWWLKTCGMNFYLRGIERSVLRYEKCLTFSVDYVQMYWKNNVQLNFNHSDFFFGVVALRPNMGYGLLTREVSRSHTTTYHSRWDSSGRLISSSQRPLPDNTQHSQQTDIHAPDGIQTHNPSSRVAADLRIRRRGHWDRSAVLIRGENMNR